MPTGGRPARTGRRRRCTTCCCDVGDLTRDEAAARCRAPRAEVDDWLDALVRQRRVIEVRVADQDRVAAAEDAARLRDAIGVALPPGLPAAFTDPVDDPLADLVVRYARTHGPFHAIDVAHRLGIPRERVEATLTWLAQRDRVVAGEFRPGGTDREWCDTEVLRRVKQRSLAALRREVEPVDDAAYARFLVAWHGADQPRRGPDVLLDAIAQLQGVADPRVHPRDRRPAGPGRRLLAPPTSTRCCPPARSSGSAPSRSDPRTDGSCCASATSPTGSPRPLPDEDDRPAEPVHDALRAHLAAAGASFWPDLFAASGVGRPGAGAGGALGPRLGRRGHQRRLRAPSAACRRRRAGRGPGAGTGGRGHAPADCGASARPSAAGRWSLTTGLRDPRADDTVGPRRWPSSCSSGRGW